MIIEEKSLKFITFCVIMSFVIKLYPREIFMTDFAKNLRLLRKQNRMSQFMLADKLGVSQRTVSHYENSSSEPSLQILCRIAHIFKVSVDELLGFVLKDED